MRKLVRIAIVAAAIGAVPVLAQDDTDEDDGGGFLENLIEDRLSGEGFEVDVRGFEGALSSRATMERIQISDEDGPWLTINNAVLDWNRSALLRGRVEIEELAAAEILLPRLPQGEPQADVPQPEAKPFSLPDLPVEGPDHGPLWQMSGRIDAILSDLAGRGITRLFCEGGGQLAASLLEAGAVDQLAGYGAGVVLGANGRPAVGSLPLPRLADAPRFRLVETRSIGPDLFHRWMRD